MNNSFTFHRFVFGWLLVLVSSWVSAFEIQEIKVEGLERIGQETVFTYLPLNLGDQLDNAIQQNSLKALYKTGFFDDIQLFRGVGDSLIIRVKERPSIAEISTQGNKLIKTDDLMTALESMGIKKGKIYNAIEMDRVNIDLQRQYHNQGYYAAVIEIQVEDLPRNRVGLTIRVEEGEPASIERINLVGNETYSDERLKGLFLLSESVIFGSGDKYAKPKLQSDFETLRSFYMDRGFAEFTLNSSQVSLSADKTKVYISASMSEGPQYKLSSIDFSGNHKLGKQELDDLAQLEQGELFSRSKIIAAINAIRDRLSEEGYAFAEVEPRTQMDAQQQSVALEFYIDPKSRVYVRKIEVENNTRTRDHVIRREMRQLERAPYSLRAVRQSTSRLNRLGFFSKVDIDTRRVSTDEIDLVVKVEEQPTGSFTAGVGYSQLDGISFNLGISEKNFLGTGNEVNLTANSSASTKSADIGFTNPYFTDDGVSFGAGIYYYEIDAAELNITDYTLDKYGVRLNLGYPTSENTRLNFGLKAESQTLRCLSDFEACTTHLNQYDEHNQYLLLTAGWRYDTRNSFYFPSDGQLTSLSVQSVVPGTSDITFYKLFAEEKWYAPISEHFTLKLNAAVASGSGYGEVENLPFYERFYAGGIGSVRGFEPNSLGGYYQDVDRPKGGDIRTLTGAEVVFPMPFIEDSSNLRLSLFFDAGNVFARPEDVELSEFRTSTGFAFSWITPVGPLAFSFAKPVKYEKDDKLQSFQFSLGVPF